VASNIFSNDPSGPDSFDNSKHFRPEVSVIFIASSDPGKREGLARVSPDNDVNQSSKSICVISQLPNVINDFCIRPVLTQDLLAVFIILTKRDCLISTHQLFTSVTKTADPSE
jgi:hypothetical protein